MAVDRSRFLPARRATLYSPAPPPPPPLLLPLTPSRLRCFARLLLALSSLQAVPFVGESEEEEEEEEEDSDTTGKRRGWYWWWWWLWWWQW